MQSPQLALDAACTVPVAPLDRRAGGVATRSADDLLLRLTNGIGSPVDCASGLRRIAVAARAAMLGGRQAPVSAEDSARAIRLNAAGLTEELTDARTRYDEFFGVRRVASLTGEEFILGVLVTVARVCEDLPNTLLGLFDLTELMRGARELLAAGEEAVRPDGRAALSAGDGTVSASPEARASYRWRVGHHMLALLSEFGRHQLDDSRRHVESGDHDRLTVALQRAETFVSAAGAAMCYAASFSSSLYEAHVRPLMERASGSDRGFSGVDNYDYLLMREAWERLHDALRARRDVIASEPRVRDAAFSLFDAIVRDNERHTLVAAAMVGTEPSLMQARVSAHAVPAVEALRQNTDARRELLDELLATSVVSDRF